MVRVRITVRVRVSFGDGGLLGVPLTKGQHQIEFKYHVKGFNIGVFLSLLSVIGIIVYAYVDKKKNNR